LFFPLVVVHLARKDPDMREFLAGLAIELYGELTTSSSVGHRHTSSRLPRSTFRMIDLYMVYIYLWNRLPVVPLA
jgi:hypothetical protein